MKWRKFIIQKSPFAIISYIIIYLELIMAAREHIVADSIWSIPPINTFYLNWSSSTNRTFFVGDTLVFRFEMGFYNVVQVSRREFEDCSAENPYQTFFFGPAIVSLDTQGMHYFICSLANYCFLGQKIAVSVEPQQPPPPAADNPFPDPAMPPIVAGTPPLSAASPPFSALPPSASHS